MKTEKYHNWQNGDCQKPKKNYFKKGFWKRYDRKKFYRNLLKTQTMKKSEYIEKLRKDNNLSVEAALNIALNELDSMEQMNALLQDKVKSINKAVDDYCAEYKQKNPL